MVYPHFDIYIYISIKLDKIDKAILVADAAGDVLGELNLWSCWAWEHNYQSICWQGWEINSWNTIYLMLLILLPLYIATEPTLITPIINLDQLKIGAKYIQCGWWINCYYCCCWWSLKVNFRKMQNIKWL